MERETIAFGLPVAGMVLTLALLGVGLFQGGLTPLAIAALALGLGSIVVLAATVASLD